MPTGVVTPKAGDRKKDAMADLYGHAGDDPSEESASESDSDSDAEEKPVEKSHIPKSRRAGVRTKAV